MVADTISLCSAIKLHDLEAAKLILNENVNVHCKNEDGLSSLDILIQQKIEMFNVLYDKKNEEFSEFMLKITDRRALEKAALKNERHHEEHLYDYLELEQKKRDNFEKEKKCAIEKIYRNIEKNDRFIEMLLRHQSRNYNCTRDTRLLKFHAACTLKNFLTAYKMSNQVRNIVTQSTDEHSPIYPGYTALHFAAYCNVNIVRMLVMKGANMMTKDANGLTPLDICVKSCSVEETISILNAIPAWKNIVFSDGETKLMDYLSSLCEPGDHKKFLQNMDNTVGLSLPKDSALWPGYTVLHISVILLSELKREMIKDILSIDMDMITKQDIHGSTPVHLSFLRNKLKVVELLLKHQKKALNPLNKDNLSHLHIAASINQQTSIKNILKKKTNLNVAYTGKPLQTVKLNWTALHTAAYTSHAVVARLLLDKGANLLQTDSQGYTAIHLLPSVTYTEKVAKILFASEQLQECVVEGLGLTHLHVATWRNKTEVIEKLLDAGSDIEATIGKLDDGKLKNYEGCRPIHIAMMGDRNFSSYKLLLARGADIFAKKLDGSSPLSTVLSGKYDRDYLMPVIDLIWKTEELQNRIKRDMGITMLHLACYVLDERMIKESLTKNIDVNAKTHQDSCIWPGFTALHVLIFTDWNMDELINRFSLLLEKGADLTVANTDGDTPALMALKARYTTNGYTRASFLMHRQSDYSVNPTNKAGMSHFHTACLLNDLTIVKAYLKSSDIDVNQAVNSSTNYPFAGQTPLLLALTARAKKHYDPVAQYKIVTLLLKHGADVHAVDPSGYTVLHKVSSCIPTRNQLLSAILIDDTDINKRAADGKTPLEILLRHCATKEEVKYFIEHGAKTNTYNEISDVGYLGIANSFYEYYTGILRIMMRMPDITEISNTGRNAIHNVAAVETSRGLPYDGSVILQLLQLGCNIFQQDNQGRTALHLAVKLQCRDNVDGLLKYGADINITDLTGKSPFSYALEFPRENNYGCCNVELTVIIQILALHVRMLQLVGLQVSELNANLLKKAMSERLIIKDSSLEDRIETTLIDAAKIKICAQGFTLRDFMYQTGVVHTYSSLNQENRESVESFFTERCPSEVFELKSFMQFQYRSARERASVVASAVDNLRQILGFPLPDLCADVIIMYLTNLDIKNMEKAATIIRENQSMTEDS